MWDLSDVSHTWYAIMQLGIRLKKNQGVMLTFSPLSIRFKLKLYKKIVLVLANNILGALVVAS